MAKQPHALSCPTCGAPLPAKIRETGHARCLYCDVSVVYQHQSVSLSSGAIPTRAAQTIGRLRRFGTIALAPVVGLSTTAMFTLQRQYSGTEDIDEPMIWIGVSVIGLMLLHRWLIAGIWLTFLAVALLMERAVASHVISPDAHFSLTAEVTLMPLIFVATSWSVFAVFWFMSQDREHEKLKVGWRSSVALMFCLGVLGGVNHYSEPYDREVYEVWTWPYAEEMRRLTLLHPQLEVQRPALPSRVDAEPKPHWHHSPEVESNVAFVPRQLLQGLPRPRLLLMDLEEQLGLSWTYASTYDELYQTAVQRGGFSGDDLASSVLRQRLERPLLADWLVVYDSQPHQIRFWLVQRETQPGTGSHSWPDSTLTPVGYRDTPWPRPGETAADHRARRRWLMEQLRDMTGGSFQDE